MTALLSQRSSKAIVEQCEAASFLSVGGPSWGRLRFRMLAVFITCVDLGCTLQNIMVVCG
jgi:hypothetical protein